MFKSLYYRSYEDSESDERGKKVYFSNPLMEKNIHKLNPGKYTNLDDYGFIKEETYITDKDVLFAKCFKTTKDDGTEVTKVVGKTANFGTSGIVDKVVVVKNKDGLRTSKVRVTRKNTWNW